MKLFPTDNPTNPKRVEAFVTFFKGYMNLSTIVVAALPIPLTSLKLIPTFEAQRSLLSLYTSLFCFLILAYIFYSRHNLARYMFLDTIRKITGYEIEKDLMAKAIIHLRPDTEVQPNIDPEIQSSVSEYLNDKYGPMPHPMLANFVSSLPILLIIASVFLLVAYHNELNYSINQADLYLTSSPYLTDGNEETTYYEAVISQTSLNDIPLGNWLILYYIGFFAAAEGAFVLMAVREWLQDTIGFTERSLILRRTGEFLKVDTEESILSVE